MHCPTAIGLLVLAGILAILAIAESLRALGACGRRARSDLWPGAIFVLVLSGWVLLWRHTCGAGARLAP